MSIALRAEASRAVVVLDGVDRVAFNADGRMELLTPAAGTPTGNDVTTAGQLGFGKMYESPEQVITPGVPISLDHDLGKIPKLVEVIGVCKTAQHGYSVGEEVSILQDATASSYNYSVGRTPTSLRCICGNSGIILHNVAGVSTVMTNANWRLIVRAWA